MTSPDDPVSPAGDAEPERADTERAAMARSTLRALQAGRSRGSDQAADATAGDAPETDAVDLTKPAADVDAAAEVDTAAEVPAEPAAEPAVAPTPSRRSTRREATPTARAKSGFPLVPVVALLTAAALVFAVVAGVVWHNAGHSSARSKAMARDAATLQARLDVEAVNTADYRQAAEAVGSWLSVSTGKLHGDYQSARTSTIKLLTEAKVSTTATVLDAAVISLNMAKGTATVIASTNVTKRPASGAAVTARNRFKATMTRVDGTWKLSDLGLVPVALS